MSAAKVSVIIPVYNGAHVVAEAVQSVLNQSYRNLEVLVVDDASADGSPDVIRQFSDSRIKLICHARNAGADAARKTGLDASSGAIISCLDQDDMFHPDKVLAHVEYLERHRNVGLTYNPYFIVSHPSRTVQGIIRPPETVALEDVLLGFPIPPSTMVLRREWAVRAELWAAETFFRGREVVFCGRLLLAGCRMAMVDQVLNWRREFVGRTMQDIPKAASEEIRCQDILLEDPRCPRELGALRLRARAHTYLEFAYIAFRQGDAVTGRRLLRDAVEARPELVSAGAGGLLRFLLLRSTGSVPEDHEATLRLALAAAASEWPGALGGWERLIGEGYLYRGGRAAVWGEPGEAASHLRRAGAAGAAPSEAFADMICHELGCYERVYGGALAAQRLEVCLSLLGERFGRTFSRSLKARYFFNRALRGSERGQRWQVVKDCARAVLGDSSYVRNRGAASIVFRAVAGRRMWQYGRRRRGVRRGSSPACAVQNAGDLA